MGFSVKVISAKGALAVIGVVAAANIAIAAVLPDALPLYWRSYRSVVHRSFFVGQWELYLVCVVGVLAVDGIVLRSHSALAKLVRPGWSERTDLFFFAIRFFGLASTLPLLFSLGTIGLVPRWVRDFRSDALSWLPEFPSVEVAALQFLVYWIIFDFFRYWWHRWMHESDLLWRFHRLHHDAESFTVLTGSRVHPIESVLSVFFVGLPMIIVGVTPVQFTALWLIRLVVDQWQHSMVPWTFGWFGRWIVFSPIGHRIHHSQLEEHWDTNYGDIMPVWDRIFGTWYAGDVINESIGNVPPAPHRPLVGQLLDPFAGLVASGAQPSVDD